MVVYNKKKKQANGRYDRNKRRKAGTCLRCPDPAQEGRVHCATCAADQCVTQAAKRLKYRNQILDHYGRACACCGEVIEDFLTLDHKNNDGAEHRRQIGGISQTYSWVVRNNFPPEFQILCANCQMGKAKNDGVCPHRKGALAHAV